MKSLHGGWSHSDGRDMAEKLWTAAGGSDSSVETGGVMHERGVCFRRADAETTIASATGGVKFQRACACIGSRGDEIE